MTPVLCGSSFKNKGVQPLLDAVIEYLPSPIEVPPMIGIEPARGDAEGARRPARRTTRAVPALAFKIMADPFVGKLTYFRVYSGKLSSGSRVLNVSDRSGTERIGRILMMHANDREEVDEVYAGDIAAAVGIKQVTTGDTLAAPDAPIKLEQIVFPEPVIKVAVEPKTKVDQEKMSIALGRLAEEDPTFRVPANQRGDRSDRDLGDGRAAPRGARRPDEARVQRRGQRRAPAGLLPRDGARRRAEKVEGKFVRQTGGSGQYGVVYIDLEPAPGEGFDFVNKIKGGVGPDRVHPGRREGHARRRSRTASRPATRWSTSA